MRSFVCADCRHVLGSLRTLSTSSVARRPTLKHKLVRAPSTLDRRPQWKSNFPLAWKSRTEHDQRASHKPETQWDPVSISQGTFFQAARSSLAQWSDSHVAVTRLTDLGIEARDAKVLLVEFHKWAQEELSKPTAYTFKSWFSDEYSWNMNSMSDFAPAIDLMLMRRFVTWAADLYSWRTKSGMTVWPGMEKIAALRDAVDMRQPAEMYPDARRIHRKIIMHVGPTNSGKTYNALRALAAARRGVYAGPLRLLAHEVFTRLNQGSILPAGIDRDPDDPDKLYPRVCNMITGEEKRILAEDAPLTSCTVEMLQTIVHYDVAVVDEIQMIGDPERGGGWTAAVLGLMADEVHLCGEASAVPIVEALVKETGDELVVNNYERLTPLFAASSSLDGNLNNLQEGDCVVAFTRNSIFKLKQRIEANTSFRCAVAYGMLPPELRAQQAALFNDPNNAFGIMVASDAIGMGLNLKIKRIIFSTTRKFNGTREITLSLSSLKQIGGRAGRFTLGQHNSSAGTVTTLWPEDLNIVQLAMRVPTRPLKRAVLDSTPGQIRQMLQHLPYNTPPSKALSILPWFVRMPEFCTLGNISRMIPHALMLESLGGDRFSLSEYWVVLRVPMPLRDPFIVSAFQEFTTEYQQRGAVDLIRVLRTTDLYPTLEHVKMMMEATDSSPAVPEVSAAELSRLEGIHRVLIAYLWLSYRLPASFHSQDQAFELKATVEHYIQWYLEQLRGGARQRPGPSRGLDQRWSSENLLDDQEEDGLDEDDEDDDSEGLDFSYEDDVDQDDDVYDEDTFEPDASRRH